MMKRLLVLSIVSLFFFITSVSAAYAAETDPSLGENNESTFLDSMLDTVFSGVDEDDESYFSSGNLIREGNDLISQALEKITDSGNGFGKAYTLFKGLAIMIMTFYFIISLTSMDYSRQFGKPSIELLAKPFAKFILCLLLIIFSEQILKFCFALSAKAFFVTDRLDLKLDIETKATLASDVNEYRKAVYDAVGYTMAADKAGFGIVDTFKNIPAFISIVLAFAIPWIISIAADLVTAWVIYSRTVNIIVRTMAAPLAMSDLYSDRNFRETHAFSFIREYTGLCFQAVVIVIIMAVLNIIMGILIKNLDAAGGFNTFQEIQQLGLKISVFKLVQVGVLIGSANTAKRIMGAM